MRGLGTPAHDFSFTHDCAGLTLNSQGTCTINIQFTPLVYGNRRAFLVVAHAGGNSPAPVRLNGQGPKKPVGWCCANFKLFQATAQQCGDSKGKYYLDEKTARSHCTRSVGGLTNR